MPLPVEIDDAETLIRVIKLNIHVDKRGRLKPQAFESPPAKDEVSVLRLNFTSIDFCKHWGKSRLEGDSKYPYSGLAALRATAVREIESTIVASPLSDCPAHADIKHGYVRPKPDEAGTAEEVQALRDRLKRLLARVAYFPDQNISEDRWVGSEVAAPN